MPDNVKELLLPSNNAAVAAFGELIGYAQAFGPAPEVAIAELLDPKMLSHKVRWNGRDVHPYGVFLENRNIGAAKLVEQAMTKDPEAKKRLADVYDTPGVTGAKPIYYFVRNKNWQRVEELVRLGVSLDNIDGKSGNLLHYVARLQPPPEGILRALEERPKSEIQILLLERPNSEGYRPYHMTRSNDMLSWMMQYDGGMAMLMAKPSNEKPIQVRPGMTLPPEKPLTPLKLLFDSLHYDGSLTADHVRGKVSDEETHRMIETIVNSNLPVTRENINSFSAAQYCLMGYTHGEKVDDRLRLLEKLHARIHQCEKGKLPAKGEFEAWYMHSIPSYCKIDRPMLCRVIERGGDLGAVSYRPSMSNNHARLLSEAVKRGNEEEVAFLLNIKADPRYKGGKDFNIDPNMSLFATHRINIDGGGGQETYRTKMRLLDTLRKAGAKPVYDEGKTPLMEAIEWHDLPVVSYYLRHNMISDKPREDALKEINECLAKVEKWSLPGTDGERNCKHMRAMIDAWRDKKPIPFHAPTSPFVDNQISRLISPADWPNMKMADAKAISAPSGVLASRALKARQA